MSARVRVVRRGAVAETRWFCSPGCASCDTDKAGIPSRIPATVPAGKRCHNCNRKVA